MSEWVSPETAAQLLAQLQGRPYNQDARDRIMRSAAIGRLRSRCDSMQYTSKAGANEVQGELSGKIWLMVERNCYSLADWALGDFDFANYYDPDLGFVAGIIYGMQLNSDDVRSLVTVSSSVDPRLFLGPDGDAPPPPLPGKGRGRPPKWDWPGADAALSEYDNMSDIYAQVIAGEKPRAVLEKWMAEWFSARNGGEAPVEAEVRKRVGRLIQARQEYNEAGK